MARRDTDKQDGVLQRLRYAAIIVILLLIVVVTVADTAGRLFINPDFHVGDFIFGTLCGVLVTLIGVEGLVRLARTGSGTNAD